MKRIVLFLATNLAVMLVLSVATSLLGVNKFLTANGLNIGMLLAFSAVIGFGGAFISLLMSKTMAKWSTGARVIDAPGSSTEMWLVDTVAKLAKRANVRNLVERIARENFRRQRVDLPAMDLVVRLHAPVAKATRAELNLDLLTLLQRLPRQ